MALSVSPQPAAGKPQPTATSRRQAAASRRETRRDARRPAALPEPPAAVSVALPRRGVTPQRQPAAIAEAELYCGAIRRRGNPPQSPKPSLIAAQYDAAAATHRNRRSRALLRRNKTPRQPTAITEAEPYCGAIRRRDNPPQSPERSHIASLIAAQ